MRLIASSDSGAQERGDDRVKTQLVAVLVGADDLSCPAFERQRRACARKRKRLLGMPQRRLASRHRTFRAQHAPIGGAATWAREHEIDEGKGRRAALAQDAAGRIAHDAARGANRFQNGGSQNLIYMVKIEQLRPFRPRPCNLHGQL